MRDLGRQLLPHGGSPTRITKLEREILVALCNRALSRPRWEQLAGGLANHIWHEPEHGVVYAALRKIRSRDQRTWREQLPAQATRMGFPDVDWAIYLAPKETSATTGTNAQVGKMVQTLKALAAECSG
ncbi:MAG: hypothetical protein ABR953_11745 [Candidatus Acidiferrales bacterium]|jgi:hypothetical protein